MKKRERLSFSKTLYLILVISSPVLTALVLAWIFTLDGTPGMLEWLPPFLFLVVFIGILGVIAPLLALPGRKRRGLRITAAVFGVIGILGAVVVGGVYLRGATQFAPSTPPILLISDGKGANGAPNLALVFRSAQATQNTLFFGVDALDQQTAETTPVREHVLALKDLKPGVHYQWRLNDGATCGFTTPAIQPASDPLYHFAAGGDAHLSGSPSSGAALAGNADILPAVLKYITTASNPFHAFFLAGDFTNIGSSSQDWQFALDKAAPFSCSLPMRPVMGNHDSFFNGAPQYLAYTYPPGMETQTGTRKYYRIDAGNVHFLMLDMLWGADTFSAQEHDWLVQQLESIPAGDWKIVIEHSMVYASGSVIAGKQYYDPAEMLEKVAPVFEKYKVNLVISGHDHHLEFLQKNGVSYAVVGGLGAPLEAVATHISPASVWYLPQQYGFIDVTVHPSTIDLHFRDQNGNELKAFIINKN